MPSPSAVQSGAIDRRSIALQIRDTLVLNEAIIVEVVNDVLESRPPHEAELFRRYLHTSAVFGAAIKRVAVDVGVVLSLAKSLEAEEDFDDAARLIHDIDYCAHDGKVAKFAKAMVECDLKGISSSSAQDAVLYELLPRSVLERRVRLVLALIDQLSRTQ